MARAISSDPIRQSLNQVGAAIAAGNLKLAAEMCRDVVSRARAEDRHRREYQQLIHQFLEVGKRWLELVQAHPNLTIQQIMEQVPGAAEIDTEFDHVSAALDAWEVSQRQRND